MMALMKMWKAKVRKIKIETYTLYLASKHPMTPWYAKIFVVAIVAYVFSPIDLIPDFIPILGYLDELIIVPLGIIVALKMIPKPVLLECRGKAQTIMNQGRPKNWFAAVIIIAIWIILAVLIINIIVRKMLKK